PRALHGAAHQRPVRQRAAPVRAAILERDVSLARASDRDSSGAHVNQLHLVDGETVRGFLEPLCIIIGADTLLLPLAGVGVAVIDANLIAVRERAAHPASHAQRCGAGALYGERRRVVALPA